MKRVNLKSIQSVLLLGLSLVFLTNCSLNRSQVGAVMGGGTVAATCAQYTTEPAAIAICTLGGSLAGANIMYNSDFDVHNAVFVDHLNTSGTGASYTNWYNQKTGNSGIIHVTRSYLVGPIKCKDYDATVDITSKWPLIGIGGQKREVVFGTACQLPDGQWVEKP